MSPAIAAKLVLERTDHPFTSLDDALSRPSLTPAERADLADERGVLVGTEARAAVERNQVDWFGMNGWLPGSGSPRRFRQPYNWPRKPILTLLRLKLSGKWRCTTTLFTVRSDVNSGAARCAPGYGTCSV